MSELDIMLMEIVAAEYHLDSQVKGLLPDIRVTEEMAVRMVEEDLACQVTVDRLVKLEEEYDRIKEEVHVYAC